MSNKLVELQDIFYIEHGHSLALNTLKSDAEGVCYVSRKGKDNGVKARVKRKEKIKPFKKGKITVPLNGSLLEAFVQQEEFYTGHLIKVLTPKDENMTLREKLFYCLSIKANKFKYSSHGREATKTLHKILVPHPDEIPDYVYNTPKINPPSSKSYHKQRIIIDSSEWQDFSLGELFFIQRGKEKISDASEGEISLISSSEINNGVTKKIEEGINIFDGNNITIANNGSVGASFYQKNNFYATPDISILQSKYKDFNKYHALFIITITNGERYRFNYGRKWGIEKMKHHIIKLPATVTGEPDWQFMEDYIKSLPYSDSLVDESE